MACLRAVPRRGTAAQACSPPGLGPCPACRPRPRPGSTTGSAPAVALPVLPLPAAVVVVLGWCTFDWGAGRALGGRGCENGLQGPQANLLNTKCQICGSNLLLGGAGGLAQGLGI